MDTPTTATHNVRSTPGGAECSCGRIFRANLNWSVSPGPRLALTFANAERHAKAANAKAAR